MATPNPFANADFALNQATFARVVHAGNGSGVKKLSARLRYNGSSWEVQSTTFSNEIVNGNLAWSTNKLTIAISGFSRAPTAVCTQVYGATTPYLVRAVATSASNIDVQFLNLSGTVITTQDTSMDFEISIEGD